MAMWPSIFTNFLRVAGRFIGTRIELTDALYLGDAETNGSLRIKKDGTDFKVERRESGSWVEKIKVGETAGYAVLTKGVQSIAGAKTFTDAATFSSNVSIGTTELGNGKVVFPTLESAPMIMKVGGSTYQGQRDDILYWGYNLGNIDDSEPILQEDLEAHYVDGSGNHWMERNLDFVSADGQTVKRFMAFQVNRNTYVGYWAYIGDLLRIESDANRENFVFVPNGTRKLKFQYEGTNNVNFAFGGNADSTSPEVMRFGPDVLAQANTGLTIGKGGAIGFNNDAPAAGTVDVGASIQFPFSTYSMIIY